MPAGHNTQRNGKQDAPRSAASPVVDLDAYLTDLRTRLRQVGGLSIAQMQAGSEAPVEHLRLMVFSLNEVRYALDIHHIAEVSAPPAVTHVPGLPRWVLGVMNMHGDIVSLVDLALFLDLVPTRSPQHPQNRVLVVQAGDQQIGLGVDRVEFIHTVPVEHVFSPPFQIASTLVPYLRGAIDIEGALIRLLDGEQLLLGPQMQQFS